MTKDGSSQTNLRIYDQSGESGGGASGVNAGVGTGSGGGLNSLRRPPGLNFLADNARNMIDAAGSSLHLGSASTNASMLLFNNSGLGGDHTTANSSLAQRPPPSNLRAYQVESKRGERPLCPLHDNKSTPSTLNYRWLLLLLLLCIL